MGLFDKKPTEPTEEEKTQLAEVIGDLRAEIHALKAERAARSREATLFAEKTRLAEEIETLKISKDRLEETNARERRELTHMIGLEKKRQEQELANARREALVEVREENLDHERKSFDDRMTFEKTQFDGQVKYLQGLMGQILERLPTVTVDRQISEKTGTKAVA